MNNASSDLEPAPLTNPPVALQVQGLRERVILLEEQLRLQHEAQLARPQIVAHVVTSITAIVTAIIGVIVAAVSVFF